MTCGRSCHKTTATQDRSQEGRTARELGSGVGMLLFRVTIVQGRRPLMKLYPKMCGSVVFFIILCFKTKLSVLEKTLRI